MVSENYAKAYKEIIEILKYTKKSDVKKIPKEKIIMWKANMNEKWNFSVDTTIELENQNILPETRAIMANIFYDYWATDYQKQRIDEKDKRNAEIQEIEKREKYNPDNIFKKKNNVNNNTQLEINQTALIEYKRENFLMKFLTKIKNILKRG